MVIAQLCSKLSAECLCNKMFGFICIGLNVRSGVWGSSVQCREGLVLQDRLGSFGMGRTWANMLVVGFLEKWELVAQLSSS